MAGENERLFSLAGRVYVVLRRQTGRMIDVEWMIANAEYAKEVLELAKQADSAELSELVTHIEAIHPLLGGAERVAHEESVHSSEYRYVGQLR